MSDFVEQCRREWSRLGVSDSLADEIAADLDSDLEEARAEGVSAEELLGSSYSEPRAFAASWAAERRILPEGRGGAGRVDPPRRRDRRARLRRLVVVGPPAHAAAERRGPACFQPAVTSATPASVTATPASCGRGIRSASRTRASTTSTTG